MNLWQGLDPSQLITLSIIVPLIGALLVVATGKIPNLREAVTLITATILFSIVLAITDYTFKGVELKLNVIELFPGLGINFAVEPLGVLFAPVSYTHLTLPTIYSV